MSLIFAIPKPHVSCRFLTEWYFLAFCRFLDPDTFVNAIAPKGDLSKIGRAQFAILFRVADTSRRGLVSWDDFTVFETLLKRPDADYWMAFQYFDVWEFYHSCCGRHVNSFYHPNRDHSGFIDFNDFKTAFSANLGPEAIPFDFDWYVSFYIIQVFARFIPLASVTG